MKKYILITVISAILISVLVYSIVYVPQVNSFFKQLFISNKEVTDESSQEESITLPVDLLATLPNLTINSSDNFKTIKFGDLNLKLKNDFNVSEATERIKLSKDEFNEIQGYFYPLNSEPRKDINPAEYESELVKNTYSLSKKSNIPDEFVRNVFNLSVGSQVEDKIEGEVVTYTSKDIVSFKNPNMAGYFFESDKLSRYKVIVLTTNKLYIFNIKTSKENLLNIQKTFYNLEKVN